jgi:hypothetical protein
MDDMGTPRVFCSSQQDILEMLRDFLVVTKSVGAINIQRAGIRNVLAYVRPSGLWDHPTSLVIFKYPAIYSSLKLIRR